MRKTIVLAAGLALLAVGTAFANEPYLPRTQKGFDKADANHDGKLALAEFTPLAERRLQKMDGNGDKAVTAAEIEARLQEVLKRRLERTMALMDTNKDGSITQRELDKIAADMFNSADTDKDGDLSMAEAHDFKRGVWRKGYVAQPAPSAGTGN